MNIETYKTLVAERHAAVTAATVEAVDALPHVASAYAAHLAAQTIEAEDSSYAAYNAAFDAAMEVATARETAARAALATYSGPMPWILRDGESGVTDTVVGSLADARHQASEWAREGDYGDVDGTIWVDVRIIDPRDGDVEETVTVAIDPTEPSCEDGEQHDWQSPHKILGGLRENPGVWGHGGGVIVYEVCVHCGCTRITNTWAQRPDTGEQGLRSLRYDAEMHRDAVIAWRRSA